MSESGNGRRFQFRLRTLLAVVTACAVLSWGYLYFWPWWLLFRAQSQFEQSVQQLKAGTPFNGGLGVVNAETATHFHFCCLVNSAGEDVLIDVYSWENACYCLAYTLSPGYSQKPPDLYKRPSVRIEAYRLPPVPRGYQSARSPDDPLSGLVRDWAERMYSNPKQPGPASQLIYSDPPDK